MSVATGVIEETWDSGFNLPCHLLKVVSPSLIVYGSYGSELYFSDLQEKKMAGKIQFSTSEQIYEGFSAKNFFLFGSSLGNLKVLEKEDVLSGKPVREKKVCHEDIIFIFEISPNFLMIFNMDSFFFLDLDTMDLVAPSHSNVIFRDMISWVHPLPNGNFIIHFDKTIWDFELILDFCSKMWESPFKWLFLGFSDKNSVFFSLPRDLLSQILEASHLVCYVL
jgi:hypothetical protein